MSVYDESEYGGLKVRKFTGYQHDWLDWKADFMAVLDNKDNLVELVLSTPKSRPAGPGAEQEKYDRDKRKIYMKLILFTSGTAKTIVQQFAASMDGVAAWNALKEKFEMKGSAQKALLQEKLYGDSMEENEDPDAYFARVEDLRRTLNALEVNITDEMMLGIVLSKLPVKYHHLRDVLGMTDDLTYAGLKEKLGRVFRREVGSGKAPRSALMTKGGNRVSGRKCWTCGGEGHLKSQCPEKNKEEDGVEKRRCHICEKVGHLKKDCPEAKQKANTILGVPPTLTF